ncbi:MAG: peptide-methionine (S)-S-oxide reductase MsrA [Akkermansiaceae bacterium]
MSEEQKIAATMPVVAEGHQQITLGAGCFWCVEAVYNRLDGIISATSGYMGGTNPKPTYEDVIRENTGEVEVVHIVYNPEKISTETILAWFWKAHDPTQADGQGGDRGPQYLSTIFCHTDEQKKIADTSKVNVQIDFKDPITTNIKMASKFHPAEVYHQDYYRLNKNKNPYCTMVIAPKMEKLNLEDKPDTTK